jgi:hypothetical protein
MSQELFDTARYLREHAQSDFAKLPEGSISKVLNNASPEVRGAMLTQYRAREHLHDTGGRIDAKGNIAPFAERIDLPPVPKELGKAIDKLRTEEITTELNQRMGTPVPTADNSPPDRREILAAAFDAHSQE